MNPSVTPLADIAAASKRVAQQALDIGANRIELLMVEVQEARERLLQTFLLALGVAAFGLLAGIAFTAGMVVIFWPSAPLLTLGILTVVYGGAAVFLYVKLARLRCEWEAFSETLNQLRKDGECLASTLR